MRIPETVEQKQAVGCTPRLARISPISKGDFRMTVFEDCSLREAMVSGSRFEGSDLRGADLGGLRLVDAGLFRGATISREQAGQLLGELGLNVR